MSYDAARFRFCLLCVTLSQDSGLMVMVYPVGVPLLMFTSLFYLRERIDRVVQDAKEQGTYLEDVLRNDENRMLSFFRHSLFEKYKPW